MNAQEITFPITIRYYLDADGREASLLAGGDGREAQTVQGEITLDQAKQAGFFVARHGGLNVREISLADRAVPSYGINPLVASDWETSIKAASFSAPQEFGTLWTEFLKIVGERNALIAEATADKAAVEAAFLAGDDLAVRSYDGGAFHLDGRWRHTYKDGPIYDEARRRYEADLAERARLEDEAREKRKAAETALANAKAAQIAEWVAQYGDQNQKERFAAGLFPQNEAIEAIKEQSFAPLDGFERYERLTVADLACDCAEYWNAGIDCETEDDAPATSYQWDRIKEMRELVPDAVVTLRKHVCRCDRCACEASRYSIYVKIAVGSFTFNRNFAA